MEGEAKLYPIQLVVNFWETSPTARGGGGGRRVSLLNERLDSLVQMGVKNITTFIPWQVVESDISHMLSRFLQAVVVRKINVSLIVTPEVGVHYPHSGLPRDVISKREDQALHFGGEPISVSLPPNIFNLPSYFSREFSRRYFSYLSRIDSVLEDLAKSQKNLTDYVRVVLTGSFWKYYRNPSYSSANPFASIAGDYSTNTNLSFRMMIEQNFSHREFTEGGVLSANRWKSQAMDSVNRRWFYQQSEAQFRQRTLHHVRKRSSAFQASEIELYTPEADPGFSYSQYLQLISGGNADTVQLSRLLDVYTSRWTQASQMPAIPYIHWSTLGGFRTLADPEKQFLILKSLLLMGGRGGGIFIDANDWFSLSNAFRTRAEAIAKLIASGELKLRSPVYYFSSHAWSSGGVLWEELHSQVGVGCRLISSLDLLFEDPKAKVLVVDPNTIISAEILNKIIAWTRSGRILVLSKTPLYSDTARGVLESTVSGVKRIDVNLGISYQIFMLGSGKLTLFEMPETAQKSYRQALQDFLLGVLSLADVESQCKLSDSRLHAIPLEKRTPQGTQLGIFILNEAHRQVAADVIFPKPVVVSDFAAIFSSQMSEAAMTVSSRFSLEVAPCGILSLAVRSPLSEEMLVAQATDNQKPWN